MAKQRMINTRFWIDDYISNLDPVEKLLFLYCLTNPYTDISGIYEIPIKHMALETGLDKEMVLKILARFERDNKIIHENGWLGIRNFAKHQLNNPKVRVGIENGLKQAPKSLLDRLSIDYEPLSHLNSNSNSNLNSNIKKGDKSPEINKIELPDWLDKKVWEEWEQHRKELKKKLTPSTIKLQLKFLETNKQDYRKIINQSIANGWTGLFELKKNYLANKSDAERKLEKQRIYSEEKRESSENFKNNERMRLLREQSNQIAGKFKV